MAKSDASHDGPLDQGEAHQHRVVVFGVPDDPHELRDLLVNQLGLNPTDAQISVHALPGVLPEHLPADKAARLSAAIRELGVNAMAIPMDEIPPVDEPQTVHHLRCLDDGIAILNLRGEQVSLIAWKNVELVSIGIVPDEASVHIEAPRMVVVKAAPHHREEAMQLPQRTGPEALIVTANPYRVLRVRHDRMNYEYLGDRLTPSATNNFRSLAGELVERAKQACVTPATRAFLDRGLFRHYEFRSYDELSRHTLFHLLVRNSRSHVPQH